MESELENGTIVTEGMLNFVDLAGSEKISNHHNLVEDNFSKTQTIGGYFIILYSKNWRHDVRDIKIN